MKALQDMWKNKKFYRADTFLRRDTTWIYWTAITNMIFTYVHRRRPNALPRKCFDTHKLIEPTNAYNIYKRYIDVCQYKFWKCYKFQTSYKKMKNTNNIQVVLKIQPRVIS